MGGAWAVQNTTTSASFCCSVGGSWRVWPSPPEPGGSGQNGAKLAETEPGEIQPKLPENQKKDDDKAKEEKETVRIRTCETQS